MSPLGAGRRETNMATMTDELVYGYCEITKTEKTPDGLMVWGKAAGSELDMDEQRCDPLWLKTAMPDWMRYGNVREQHLQIAAGVGKELTEQNDGWYLKSLVVDPVTIKKVETGVLKGYSVGVKHGKVVKAANAPKGLINGGTIVEVSLVDRPANPTATMMICKSAGGTFVPVDREGHMLKAAEPDLIKSARATVRSVLHDDLVVQLDEAGDIAAAKARIDEICDLVIHSATVLKSAAADDTVDIGDLQDAVSALGEFAEGDGPDYDGIGDDAAAHEQAMPSAEDELVEKMLAKAAAAGYIVKAAGVRSADDVASGVDAGATLMQAEITKAVAKATAPLEEQLKAAQADLAEAMRLPRSGGPVLITQPTAPTLAKSAEADRYRAIADRTTDPELALAYRRAAEKVGVSA